MHWIEKCLGNLFKSSIPLIPIVIDNCSIDGTLEYIKKEYPNIKLIENNENFGFCKANNIGLKYALEQDADYVLLLNQDVYLQNNTIEKLINLHNENPEFGIISPVHLNGEGTNLDRNFSTYTPYRTLERFRKLKENNLEVVKTDFVNAAAWLVPINCIKQVGGFDPLFTHYGEDRDFCYRATYHGFKIGIVTNSLIIHDRQYDKNNKFRSLNNHLYSVGLAHVKNINKSLISAYVSWLLLTFKRTVKNLLSLKLKEAVTEVFVALWVIKNLTKVKNSRIQNKSKEICVYNYM